MYSIKCTPIERHYANYGMHAEQMLAYTLTNQIRTHEHVTFDNGSDIPEYHMSVKSSKATLTSANLMTSSDFEGQINEYFDRVASTSFAYVAFDGTAYIMTAIEFRNFLYRFSRIEHESIKNGGGIKIRLHTESKKMLKWLNELS